VPAATPCAQGRGPSTPSDVATSSSLSGSSRVQDSGCRVNASTLSLRRTTYTGRLVRGSSGQGAPTSRGFITPPAHSEPSPQSATNPLVSAYGLILEAAGGALPRTLNLILFCWLNKFAHVGIHPFDDPPIMIRSVLGEEPIIFPRNAEYFNIACILLYILLLVHKFFRPV
jgi:hypothetical protein